MAIAKPSNVSVVSTTPNSVSLKWRKGQGTLALSATLVLRAPTSSGPWEPAATLQGGVSQFTDTQLQPATTYWYRVKNVSGTTMSDLTDPIPARTRAVSGAPRAPSSLIAAGVSPQEIDLSWQSNSTNEDGFRVERATTAAGPFAPIGSTGPGVTSYLDLGGLQPATTYYYQVQAFRGARLSFATRVASATTQPFVPPPPPLPPPSPSGLAATQVTQTEIDLVWVNNAADDTSVEVHHSDDGVAYSLLAVLPAGSEVYQDTGLSPNTLHYYEVRQVSAAGNGQFSTPVSATTLTAFQVPADPSNLVVQAGAAGTSAILNWTDNANNEDAYEVDRSADNVTWAVLAANLPPNTTIFNDAGPLTKGQTYYYRVRAFNITGNSAYINRSVTMPTSPAAPSGLAVTVVSSSQLTPHWADNSSNEAGFALERSLSVGGPFVQVGNVLPPGTTSFTDNGLTAGTLYFYRVKATGGILGDSAYSAVASGTTTAAGVSTGYPAGYILPPPAVAPPAGARTNHPRLMITADNLATYRSWAINTNPRWNALVNVANGVKAYYLSGQMYAQDNGADHFSGQRQDGARIFALMSLLDPDAGNRDAWGILAHTLLMDLINIEVLGSIQTSPATPFRDPGYSSGDTMRGTGDCLPLVVDWIYDRLSPDDKAKIRQVFLRWTQERVKDTTSFAHPGSYYSNTNLANPKVYRFQGNNYHCCNGRNVILSALCFDPADDVPANPGGSPAGYDTVPAGALTGMINGYHGLWSYLRDYFEQHDTRGGFSQEGVEYGTSSSMAACKIVHAALALTGHDDEATYGVVAGWGNHQFWQNDFPTAFLHSWSPVMVDMTPYGLPYHEYVPHCYADVQDYGPPNGFQLYAGLAQHARAKGNTALDHAAQWMMLNFSYQGPDRFNGLTQNWQVWGTQLAYYAFLTLDPNIVPADPRSGLPLDVYGAGLGRMISRDQWGANGRAVSTINQWSGTDHIDNSSGGFEFFRKGAWLTKYMNGYGVMQGCSDRKNNLSIENNPDARDHWYSTYEQYHGSEYFTTNRGDPTNIQSFGSGYAFHTMITTELFNEVLPYLSQDIGHASTSLFWWKPDWIFVYHRVKHVVADGAHYSRLPINSVAAPVINGNVATVTDAPTGQRLFMTSLLPAAVTITAGGIPKGQPANPNETGTPANFEPMKNQTIFEAAGKPQTTRFLTVFEGADPGAGRTDAVLVQQALGDAYDGAKVGGTLVMFKNDITQVFSGLTFNAPAGTTAAYVTGLVPGANYTVAVVGAQVTVSPGGVRLADAGGVIKAI